MNGIITTSDSFSLSGGDAVRDVHTNLLGAYPEVLAHTDVQFELLEALKRVKALCRDDLTQEERRLVTQAHDFFEERLRIRVI